MRTLYKIFDDAQQLLEMGWVSGRLAVDEDGRSVNPEDEKAKKWCQIGALQAIIYYEAPTPELRQRLLTFCNSTIRMANSSILNYAGVEDRNDQNERELAIRTFENTKQYIAKSEKMGLNYVPQWLALVHAQS